MNVPGTGSLGILMVHVLNEAAHDDEVYNRGRLSDGMGGAVIVSFSRWGRTGRQPLSGTKRHPFVAPAQRGPLYLAVTQAPFSVKQT